MRTIAKWFLGGTILFAVIAVLWLPVVVPQLTKYPDNVDVKVQYAGTFTTYMDQKTGAPLAQPVTAPLTVDRVIKSVKSEYSASKAVVKETIDARVAGTVIDHEDNQYVLDRTNMKNVDDPRAYAFTPSNKVNRAGTYTIQFPMGINIDTAQYKQWTNQTSATYDLMKAPGKGTGSVNGLSIVRMSGTQEATPVSPYYAQVLQAQGLPAQLTAAQMQATLAAKGINVSQAVTGLATLLTPDELATVQKVFSSPVPLQYKWQETGAATVEPKTGAPVSVTGADQAVVVSPDMTAGLAALTPIFTKYASVPAVASAASQLQQLAKAEPQKIFEMKFTQTPPTVKSISDDVKSNVTKLNWVKTYIPLILTGIAIILLIATFVTRKPRHPEEAAQVEVIPPEREVPKAA